MLVNPAFEPNCIFIYFNISMETMCLFQFCPNTVSFVKYALILAQQIIGLFVNAIKISYKCIGSIRQAATLTPRKNKIRRTDLINKIIQKTKQFQLKWIMEFWNFQIREDRCRR